MCTCRFNYDFINDESIKQGHNTTEKICDTCILFPTICTYESALVMDFYGHFDSLSSQILMYVFKCTLVRMMSESCITESTIVDI